MLILLGFSTLLIISFQNCQGIDAETLQSSLQDPNAGNNSGSGDLTPTPEPNPEPTPEPEPVLPTACELGNVLPSWAEVKLNNGNNNDEAVFYSEIDEDTGTRFASSFTLRAIAGKKGIDPSDSSAVNDPSQGVTDTLRNVNCNLTKVGSFAGTLNVNCTLGNDNVNVMLDNSATSQCVEGLFKLTVELEDSCGAELETLEFDVRSHNVCFNQASHQDSPGGDFAKQSYNFAYELKKSDSYLLANAPLGSAANPNGGTFYVYTQESGSKNLVHKQTIEPSDARNDKYQHSAITDEYLAVGSSSIGKVKLYKMQSGSYQFSREFSINYGNAYQYGRNLAIFNGTLAVGSPGQNTVYFYNLSTGALVDSLVIGGLTQSGKALESFKWNGNEYLIVSSMKDGNGHVSIYSTGPVVAQKIGEIQGSESCFGEVLKADGTYVFIGSPCSGIAKVYGSQDFVNANTKTPIVNRQINRGDDEGKIGGSFAHHNGVLMFGGPEADMGRGFIHVERADGSDMDREMIKAIAATTHAKQEFGTSMVSWNGRLYVGAPFYSSGSETLRGRIINIDLEN